ncbi:DNA polymerase III delta prime subunit [Halanaerobium saccharolyticum]|uniref:DNA polymerase III subunit delta' n=1 Tax=Halanaerobium saccharolyticum TaxID=43595 RepID=A0A4R7YNI2_9FIRM|nr:DNA polymerase III subunit delta' [Halanaerobium saccharolyticum]RAK04991.1 DNA polymerase III delta prime subunit [Halanaerobium saccharolyticum]TDV98345.1 DNA polymerase III delta prime subunit [Halanaerobium saccharolyticum]TDX51343.1 DNA polymerase III delta prime subunit [Halanaerobium saccharolyticum]
MSFNSVIGQKEAVEILQDEIKTDRISHAYLFSAKEGTGKSKLAFEFAKASFCEESEADSCGSCINCRKMDHQNHPDFKMISVQEGKSAISIDQIRELKKEIAYKPYDSDHKIYIMETAEKMTKEAANSLLKTLEEPPSFATIILLVEDSGKLLPTIVSRCQQIKLRNVSKEKIKELLLAEGLEAKRAEIVSSTAAGSPGKALEIIKIDNYFEQRQQIYDFLKDINSKNTIEIFQITEKLTSLLKTDFPCFNLLSDWYRDIMMIKQDYLDAVTNKDYFEQLKELAAELSLQNVIRNLELIAQSEEYIERNIRAELSLEVLFFKLRQPDQE